eukprot:1185412-Pyramimonas_sp.AAC.1
MSTPRRPKRAPKWPKRAPRRPTRAPQRAPTRPQDGPGMMSSKCFLRGHPKHTSHGCPKDARRGPKRSREGPNAGPGGSERADARYYMFVNGLS